MRKALHLIVKKDELAEKVLEHQKQFAEVEVLTLEAGNYGEVVDKIFEADSVAVWS